MASGPSTACVRRRAPASEPSRTWQGHLTSHFIVFTACSHCAVSPASPFLRKDLILLPSGHLPASFLVLMCQTTRLAHVLVGSARLLGVSARHRGSHLPPGCRALLVLGRLRGGRSAGCAREGEVRVWRGALPAALDLGPSPLTSIPTGPRTDASVCGWSTGTW